MNSGIIRRAFLLCLTFLLISMLVSCASTDFKRIHKDITEVGGTETEEEQHSLEIGELTEDDVEETIKGDEEDLSPLYVSGTLIQKNSDGTKTSSADKVSSRTGTTFVKNGGTAYEEKKSSEEASLQAGDSLFSRFSTLDLILFSVSAAFLIVIILLVIVIVRKNRKIRRERMRRRERRERRMLQEAEESYAPLGEELKEEDSAFGSKTVENVSDGVKNAGEPDDIFNEGIKGEDSQTDGEENTVSVTPVDSTVTSEAAATNVTIEELCLENDFHPDETSRNEASMDKLGIETHVAESVIEETPAEEVPAEEATAEEATAEEATAEETPVEETPVEESVTDDISAAATSSVVGKTSDGENDGNADFTSGYVPEGERGEAVVVLDSILRKEKGEKMSDENKSEPSLEDILRMLKE